MTEPVDIDQYPGVTSSHHVVRWIIIILLIVGGGGYYLYTSTSVIDDALVTVGLRDEHEVRLEDVGYRTAYPEDYVMRQDINSSVSGTRGFQVANSEACAEASILDLLKRDDCITVTIYLAGDLMLQGEDQQGTAHITKTDLQSEPYTVDGVEGTFETFYVESEYADAYRARIYAAPPDTKGAVFMINATSPGSGHTEEMTRVVQYIADHTRW